MTQAPSNSEAFSLIALGRTDSTNAEARRRAETGAAHGTLLWATEQTAGHGRRGREWVSKPGNFYASLILRPACEARQATQLAFVTALAVGALLEARFGVGPRYKWPNDVLVDGCKIAGILAESMMGKDQGVEWMVLGVGINVASHPEGVEYPATSLHGLGSKRVKIAELAEAFGEAFFRCYDSWEKEGFAPVREAWLRRAAGIGEPIRVRLEQETIEGKFEDLDAEGALLLLKEGSADPVRITTGDVFPMSVIGDS